LKKINTENIPNPNWIAGFVSGDGNFDVNITPLLAVASSPTYGSYLLGRE